MQNSVALTSQCSKLCLFWRTGKKLLFLSFTKCVVAWHKWKHSGKCKPSAYWKIISVLENYTCGVSKQKL